MPNIIAFISVLSPLIPLAFCLYHFRTFQAELKLLCLLEVFSFICDILSLAVPLIKLKTNYLGTLYEIGEFTILFFLYFGILKPKKSKWIFILIGFSFILFSSLNFLFLQHEKLNSFTFLSSSIIFIWLSVVYFFSLMKDLPTYHLEQIPMFWINTAVLIFFSGNFFLFLTTDYLIKVSPNDFMVHWSLHNILNIVKNLLFTIAFWHAGRKGFKFLKQKTDI